MSSSSSSSSVPPLGKSVSVQQLGLWAPNSLVALQCSQCRDPFNSIRRRHFCRVCSRTFCSKCSARRLIISDQSTDAATNVARPVRCCDACFSAHFDRVNGSSPGDLKRGDSSLSLSTLLETSGVNQLFSAVGALFSSANPGNAARVLPPADKQIDAQRSTLFRPGSDAERHFYGSKELAIGIWRDFLRVSRVEKLRIHVADLTVHTGQRKNIDSVGDSDLDSAYLMLQAAFYRNFAKLTVATENAAAAPLPFSASGTGVAAALAVAAAVTPGNSPAAPSSSLASAASSGLSAHVSTGSAAAAVLSPRQAQNMSLRSPMSMAAATLSPSPRVGRPLNAPEPAPQPAPPAPSPPSAPAPVSASQVEAALSWDRSVTRDSPIPQFLLGHVIITNYQLLFVPHSTILAYCSFLLSNRSITANATSNASASVSASSSSVSSSISSPRFVPRVISIPLLTIEDLVAAPADGKDVGILEIRCKDFRQLRMLFTGLTKRRTQDYYRQIPAALDFYSQFQGEQEIYTKILAFRHCAKEFSGLKGREEEIQAIENEKRQSNQDENEIEIEAELDTELEAETEDAENEPEEEEKAKRKLINEEKSGIIKASDIVPQAEMEELDSDEDDESTINSRTASAAYQPVLPRFPVRTSEAARWHAFEPDREYMRLGVPSNKWRITAVNENFQFAPTYPRVLVVPKLVADGDLQLMASFRSKKRIPVLAWQRPPSQLNSAGPIEGVILRSSQPMAGMLGQRNQTEELYFNHVCAASGTSSFLIFDARPLANAVAQSAMGAGYETADNYLSSIIKQCRVEFGNIENIHAMRKWYKAVQKLEIGLQSGEENEVLFHGTLQQTQILSHLMLLLHASNSLIRSLRRGASCLVHCSDGWDRTAGLVSLAKLSLDPHYRTIEGFCCLIEMDWIQFGHKFTQRLMTGRLSSPSEFSPIFVQFLDAVAQYLHQHPNFFQFTTNLLLFIAEHIYTGLYGNFLYSNEQQRALHRLDQRTPSIWASIMAQKDRFINPMYGCGPGMSFAADGSECLEFAGDSSVLSVDLTRVTFWSAYYSRWHETALGLKPEFTGRAAQGASESQLASQVQQLSSKLAKAERELALIKRELLSAPETPQKSQEVKASAGSLSRKGHSNSEDFEGKLFGTGKKYNTMKLPKSSAEPGNDMLSLVSFSESVREAEKQEENKPELTKQITSDTENNLNADSEAVNQTESTPVESAPADVRSPGDADHDAAEVESDRSRSQSNSKPKQKNKKKK